MTDIITSQYIDLSSWIALYSGECYYKIIMTGE